MEHKPRMEKENLIMSLLALNDSGSSSSSATTASQDHENNAAASAHATFASMFSGVNLHSLLTSNTAQPLLPLSLFADAYCNLASSTTPVASLSPPKPEAPPRHQYGAADYSIFNHLPDLLTLDQLQSPKRPRFLNHHPLPLNLAATSSTYHQLMPPTAVAAPPPSARQRRRRQTLSDKTRCLAKLLPWDHKMDTATMLQSAHAYVRFLQAQVAALQAMPIVASDSLPELSRGGGDDVEVLRRLSRSQLLQVLVNSPVLQTWMCRRGVCVFSSEQLALVNRKSAAVRSAMVSASGGHYYSSSFMDSSASASGTNYN